MVLLSAAAPAPARALRHALLIAILALAALAAAPWAPRADAVEIGISDSNATTLVEPHWDALRIDRVRVVVPYDVATTTGAAGIRRRREFEALRAQAQAKGVRLYVVFAASQDLRAPDGFPIPPTAEEYAAGVAAFLQRYPEIRTLGAWNEPNNPEAEQYPLSGDPALAATYWLRAKALCPACTVVAGGFAGIPNDDAYVDAYLAALGDARPEAWAFHTHSDINAFQAGGPDSARIARYYLGKLQGPWAGTPVWIDEVGARFRDPSGQVWGDASQAEATQFLVGLAALDPRVTEIYYYNYSNQCSASVRCAIQDRGLVSPNPWDGTPLDYDTPNRRRPAFDVVANRGPAIAPADLVPPVVTIEQPAQTAAVATATPTFAGQAATGGRAQPSVTVQIFSGVSATQGVTPLQTATGAVAGGRWSATAAALPDGTYTARAVQAGNPTSSGVSQDAVFTVDTVAPTAEIAGGPAGATTGLTRATFTLAASEVGARFACSLDGAPYEPCGARVALRGLELGAHVLRVRAVDAAGNVQRAAAVRRWSVVSLATALLPRAADLASAFDGGVPVAATCAARCRVDVRLYMPRAAAQAAGLAGRAVRRGDPARPTGRGYVVVGGAKAVRTRGGVATLAPRLRAASSAAAGAARVATVRLGVALRPTGTRRAVTASRRVTLARSGWLRGIAARGVPVTAVCTSACSALAAAWVAEPAARVLRARGRAIGGGRANGLPRGRYLPLGSATATRPRAGATDLNLVLPRAVRGRVVRRPSLAARVTLRASGPGTAARAVSWPLTLRR